MIMTLILIIKLYRTYVEPELKLSGPNSSNSPRLDQWQGYSADSEAAGTSDSCEPKVADSHLERHAIKIKIECHV